MNILFDIFFWYGVLYAAIGAVLVGTFVCFKIADWRRDRDASRRIDRFMAGEERKALKEAEMWGQVAELEQTYALPSAEEPRA